MVPPLACYGSTTSIMAPYISLWRSSILVEGKGGSPPLSSMGQLSEIGLVMFDPHVLDLP
jgi:hypothetical protein